MKSIEIKQVTTILFGGGYKRITSPRSAAQYYGWDMMNRCSALSNHYDSLITRWCDGYSDNEKWNAEQMALYDERAAKYCKRAIRRLKPIFTKLMVK